MTHSLRGGEEQKKECVLLPDEPAAVCVLGQGKGGAGRPARGGPVLKNIAVEVLCFLAAPGHRAEAALGIQGEQNVIEHGIPSCLTWFSVTGAGGVVKKNRNQILRNAKFGCGTCEKPGRK